MSDSKPYACAPEADDAHRLAARRVATGRARGIFISCLLTGCCPICGTSISRLTGRTQPKQPWEIPE